MPSYTPLKVLLMDDGTEDTTWGQQTNSNWNALETTIGGLLNVPFSSADVTIPDLVNSNAPQDARNLFLNLTGTSGGARNLIVPASPSSAAKLYIVKNNLADTVTVKTLAGSGVAIPTGKTGMVIAGPVNVEEAVSSLGSANFTNVTITGGTITGITDLAVADGGTGVGSFTAGAYLKGNGTNPLIVQTAPIPVSDGGTGAITVSAGLVVANGTSAFTSVAAPTGTVVGTTDTQTLTNKTLTNPTVTNYTETVVTSTGNTTLNLTSGTLFKVTTNGNNTITLPASSAGKSFIVIVAYGGTHTVTWAGGSTIKWAFGSAPVQTSANGKFDIFSFFQDGTNTYGGTFGTGF